MSEIITINILDALDSAGEDEIQDVLAGFSCAKNQEIEHFLHKNAIDFAKKKISITYLVFDDRDNLLAYFTLANRVMVVSDISLSNTTRKRLGRYAKINIDTHTYNLAAFLIAQFGKNDSIADNVSGNALMSCAVSVLRKVQRSIGGGVVFLECEKNERLLEFYTNERNNFGVYGKRIADDGNEYLQLMRFF